MRSIKRRFKNFQTKSGGLSSYINFARAVSGQGFSENILSRWFNKLVEKDDYDKKDRKQIIRNLVLLSKPPEEHRF